MTRVVIGAIGPNTGKMVLAADRALETPKWDSKMAGGQDKIRSSQTGMRWWKEDEAGCAARSVSTPPICRL